VLSAILFCALIGVIVVFLLVLVFLGLFESDGLSDDDRFNDF
jgi:hypothetical protein